MGGFVAQIAVGVALSETSAIVEGDKQLGPYERQDQESVPYNESLKRRGSLSIWFDPEMVWTPPPNGKAVGRQHFSHPVIQTRLMLKVLFGLPLRQATWFVQSLLQLVGLDRAAPDFSTLCRRQKALNVSLPYRVAKGPLKLLIPYRDPTLRHCRAMDALYETTRPISDREGLRTTGRGDPNPRQRPQPPHGTWQIYH